MKRIFQWLFNDRETDLVTLIAFSVGIIVISVVITPSKNEMDWSSLYWMIPIILLILVSYRVLEGIVSYFLGDRNRKINFGYIVLSAFGIALLNTFILN